MIILRGLGNTDEAVTLAETLRAKLGLPIQLDQERMSIDATIGISVFPEHGESPDELIRAADVAMYAGKEERRGKVRIFDPSLACELAERHQLEQSLREAIANDTLSLVFQPIVSAATGECEALEALLRWDHPTLGRIPPNKFIPIAERCGEIVNIGSWVLRQACRAAAAWKSQTMAVSINVSAAQILSGDVASEVFAALLASGLSPSRLHIELTESVFATNHPDVSATLAHLRENGVRVSLDDFGTGFSSLAYLQTLPIDIVKIDQSFVRKMQGHSLAVVRAIVSIAKALDFQIVAEGVETGTQAIILREMGVDMLQGYLYSRPIPAAEVQRWLSEREHLLLREPDCSLSLASG